MLRCAIYARYSSDMQSESSIEDQVRVCRARAEREGWQVGDVYADYALSGASASRPRYQQMLADAQAGKLDIVMAEALDRLSRDQEHIAGFHKQMQFRRVRVVTLAEGDISELHVGLTGTMSALFLKGLSQKTHRGLEGRVRAGKSGGGLSYGYRVRRGLKPDGTPITGELEIIPEQSAVLTRVFEAYAAGQSPRAIARMLNAEGVPGPRGGKWTAGLLSGRAARGSGLLRNRLYVGERVWDRQRFVKDPDTGKRIARLNPQENWVTTAVPELAIIDRETWDRVETRLGEARRLVSPEPNTQVQQGNMGTRLASARRPKWPLAGLVRCGLCEGPMSVSGAGGRLACANHVECGTCSNRRKVLRDKLLARVMVALKERLMAPELVEAFARAYVEEVNAANRDRGARRAGLEARHAKLDRQVRNFLDLIKEGHGSPAMVADLREIERQRAALAEEIAATGVPEAMPMLHPRLPELYRRRVEVLEQALIDPTTAMAATEALRGLINAILIHPGEGRGEISVTLRGDLAAFLRSERGGEKATKKPLPMWRTAVLAKSWQRGMRGPDRTETCRSAALPDRGQALGSRKMEAAAMHLARSPRGNHRGRARPRASLRRLLRGFSHAPRARSTGGQVRDAHRAAPCTYLRAGTSSLPPGLPL
jgi:site-specific DNA recombinase